MYKRILVPVDGSDTSKLGLHEAVRLAKDIDAELRLLHVIDETVMVQYAEAPLYTVEMMRSLEDRGRKVLADAQADVRKQGLDADVVLEKKMGGVADAIVEQARRWSADVIVLGTHGRRGIGRLVMGSDAESVIRTAPVPVLLVNALTLQQSRKGMRHPRSSGRTPSTQRH